VTAAFIRREDFYGRTRASLGVLADEGMFPIEIYGEPRGVACAVNSTWKRNRLFTVAGGGVSIRPEQAFAEERLLSDQHGELAEEYREARAKSPTERWRWD
jgi:hypothetical protein